MSEIRHVLNLGLGVQSSTMALLAAHELIRPMPDFAIFADTGWEASQTYKWLEQLRDLVPFEIVVVSKGNIRTENTKNRARPQQGHFATMPFFVDTPGSRREGRMRRQCTYEYKIKPIRAYIKQRYSMGARARTTDKPITQWIGISTDEASRMKPADVAWVRHRFPLAMELGMSRQDCKIWLLRNGYPIPMRSACTGCPYRSDAEWSQMRRHHPDQFSDAVDFDKSIRQAQDMRGETYLHRSLKPLAQVQFDNENQRNLFAEECEGLCGL